MKRILFFIAIIISIAACKKNKPTIDTPHEPEFHTSDIALFWDVFDNSDASFSSQKFKANYINKGTEGLKDYAALKNLAPALQSTLTTNGYLEYYNSVRENTLDLSATIQQSEAAFSQLKAIYSATKIPSVYFLIGALTAGGKVSDNGLLIAVEMFSKNEDTALDDLDEWHQNVIRNKAFLPSIVMHEMTHIQQVFEPQNLIFATTLEQSIREGMADFVSHYFLSDKPFTNGHLHTYGNPIEEDLWNEFKTQMNSNYQNTEWLYTGSETSEGHPADMGYYIGYKILEAYSTTFDNADDAIKAMLSATNYKEIFEISRYEDKF